MRTYASFYNGNRESRPGRGYIVPIEDDGTWQVIYQDSGEESWYIEVPDAGSRESAVRLSAALNEQSRSNNDAR